MKKMYAWMLLSILWVSCSSDEKSLDTKPGSSEYLRTSDTNPTNVLNPQDSVGMVYSELLNEYYSTEVKPASLDSLLVYLATLSDANPSFLHWKGSGYQVPNNAHITFTLQDPSASLSNSITQSGISEEAQNSLATFVDDLLILCEEEDDYTLIHEYITTYEDSIVTNGNFSTSEKELLLVTTSLLRHSTHAKKKRPKKNTDPEWALMVGNFTGAIEGASEDRASAIMYALAFGIAENDF
jgi:hypothetical protein